MNTHWIWWPFVWIVIWVFIWPLFGMFLRRGRRGKNDKSALEILNERYAKGDITKQEFEEKKRDIIS